MTIRRYIYIFYFWRLHLSKTIHLIVFNETVSVTNLPLFYLICLCWCTHAKIACLSIVLIMLARLTHYVDIIT